MPAYAGIGSRKTPEKILGEMRTIATRLEKYGYTLRSGGAKGADSAFEAAAKRKEIFYASDCENWCLEMVSKYVPSDRPPLERMNPYIQKLLGRNMKQLFGHNGNDPVDFVVCWTPHGDQGGTGYAIRAAEDYGISVYNLNNKNDREDLKALLATLKALQKREVR